MAWEARSGLKLAIGASITTYNQRLNGLGSPFGIETLQFGPEPDLYKRRLNGLGSPFGIETV